MGKIVHQSVDDDLRQYVKIKPDIEEVKSQLAESVKFNGQVDFVDLIKNRVAYDGLYVKKITNPYEALSVYLINGNNHITYEFRKNTNDDFYIFHTAFAGDVSTLSLYKNSTSSKTGTWTALDGSNNIYTTQVGATFTVQSKGERLELNHNSDNRGGVFEIVIDNDTVNPITISTYSSSASATKTQLLKEGLNPNVTHTIVGTFKGDDPNNPPSGGAGTARGWIKDGVAPANQAHYTIIGGNKYNGTYLTNKMLLGYASNKEFAFSVEKNGDRQWFPEHNSTGTAFKLNEPKFILDGKELSFSTMVTEEIVKGVNFRLVQKVGCKLPTITDNIAEIEVVHNINIGGTLAVSGNIKFLQSCIVRNGYTMMFPLVTSTLNELVTGIGNSRVNVADESVYYLPEEQDKVFSFCGIDSRNPDYISAVTFDFPYKTLRIGQSDRANDFYYYLQRANYPKLYANVFSEHNAVVGEKYSFNGRYTIGKINGIYNDIT